MTALQRGELFVSRSTYFSVQILSCSNVRREVLAKKEFNVLGGIANLPHFQMLVE
jgi:hypothetical protein